MCECSIEQIKKLLLEEIGQGNTRFAIYPYGKYGQIVEEILEQERVSYIIIDDNLAKNNKRINKLSKLKEKEYSGYTVLLCSNSLFYYDSLRTSLSAINNKIIDVCLQGSLFAMLSFKEPRLAALECAAREIYNKRIDGNVAEAGVFRGDFAKHINNFFHDRKLYLIDTFDGFDQRDIKVDVRNSFSVGTQDWSNTSIQLVLSKMRYVDNCIVKKGYFPEIMKEVKDQFCFVSLDMDLYQPTYAGLQYFYPKLSHGGYIFIHDCRNLGYQGSRKAVINFCEESKIGYVLLQDQWGTAVIAK